MRFAKPCLGSPLTHVGLSLLFSMLLVPDAFADENGKPIILPGREQAVEHLFAPYSNGQEVAPGWRLGDMRINRTDIVLDLQGEGRSATLRLQHVQDAPDALARSTSFATTLAGPPEARVAADRLIAAIARNDHGNFWSLRPEPQTTTGFAGKLLSVLSDALFLTILAIVGLILHLRRVLRPLPQHVGWLLFGVVVLGTLFRAMIAVPTTMNAWPYTRIVPAVWMMAGGPVLPAILRLTGTHVGLYDAMFDFDFLVACLTPAAIFAHARYVLGGWRSALAAAALMAVLPLHIRFSRSDTELILALGLSSLSFLALYASMRAERPVDRWLARPILLVLGLATYLVRNETVALAGVDLGAIVLTAGVGVPLRRRLGTAMIVMSAAIGLFIIRGQQILQSVKAAGKEDILLIGLRSIALPESNPLINPWIMPPLLMLLTCIGIWWLWRTGERAKVLYLGCWLVGMFFVYYPRAVPAMQARYHLSLATPLVLLAAAGTPWLLSWRRVWIRNALVAGVLLSPLLHLDFERDVNYTEIREFEFVRAMARELPNGLAVVEYMPTRDPTHPETPLHGRWAAMGREISGDGLRQRWTIVEAEQWLKQPAVQPPQRVYYYDGLACQNRRPLDLRRASPCATVRAQAQELVASVTLPVRFYDFQNAAAYDGPPDEHPNISTAATPEAETIALSLFRLR